MHQNFEFRYRSIKYSTSSFNLTKTKTETAEERPTPKGRLSLAKENRSSQIFQEDDRPKTPKMHKMIPLESRWGVNKHTSSHYKLRIVANSSHIRTRASEQDGEQKGEEQCRILPVGSGCPPYFTSHSFLQEAVSGMQPILSEQGKERERVRQALALLQQQVEEELRATSEWFHEEIVRIRLQMGSAFKEHSRQIINTRENISTLRACFSNLSCSVDDIRCGLIGMDDVFNG